MAKTCRISVSKKEIGPMVFKYRATVDDQVIELTPMQVVKLNNALHEMSGNSNTSVFIEFTDTGYGPDDSD